MKKFSEFVEQNDDDDEKEATGWGISSDGWNMDDLADAGLAEVLDDVDRVAYELKNAIRGSYADFGDTIEDLVSKLNELSEQFAAVAAAVEEMAEK